jgi:hypothetical protein
MATRQGVKSVRRRTWRTSHVAIACFGLSAIFGVGLYVASTGRAPAIVAEPFGPPAPRTASEAGLRTAKIWVSSAVPSDQCRQLTFDNFVGGIRDEGRAQCNDTFSQPSAGSTKDGTQHVQTVRDGFNRR